MQHAKAPWRVMRHTSGHNYDGLIIVDANGWNVANLWHNQHLQDQEYIAQREANANLIVAAPDLLAALGKAYAALQDIRFETELLSNAQTTARNAIPIVEATLRQAGIAEVTLAKGE